MEAKTSMVDFMIEDLRMVHAQLNYFLHLMC